MGDPSKKFERHKLRPEQWDEHLWGYVVPPSVRAVRHHYDEIGVHKWDNNKVFALARRYNLTLCELCNAVAYGSKTEVAKSLDRNQWPGPVGLLFTMMNDLWFATYGMENRPPVVPLDKILKPNEY